MKFLYSIGPKGEMGNENGLLAGPSQSLDMEIFRDISEGKALLSGRKTAESMVNMGFRAKTRKCFYLSQSQKWQNTSIGDFTHITLPATPIIPYLDFLVIGGPLTLTCLMPWCSEGWVVLRDVDTSQGCDCISLNLLPKHLPLKSNLILEKNDLRLYHFT